MMDNSATSDSRNVTAFVFPQVLSYKVFDDMPVPSDNEVCVQFMAAGGHTDASRGSRPVMKLFEGIKMLEPWSPNLKLRLCCSIMCS